MLSALADVSERIQFTDYDPPTADMRREVIDGLAASQKRIPPKYFYDEAGSQLFDQITELPEYYPTRTEISILERITGQLGEIVGQEPFLVEYGSGNSRKVRILLEELRPSGYMPIDISKDHMLNASEALAGLYPWLSIYPTCADYSTAVKLPEQATGLPVMGFFPGSSLGNFEPVQRERFLRSVNETVGEGGYFLIGVDRKKDRDVLERAYNDAAGVTADFNLNVLSHIRRRLGGNVSESNFAHKAFYNEDDGRIEMHLLCLEDHVAEVADQSIPFRSGETVHTECSYKYGREEFLMLADRCGFDNVCDWSDDQDWFSVFLLQARKSK